MTSAFYESNLQQQRHCVIAKTYESKSFFFINCQFLSCVISVKCCFDQVSLRSSTVVIKCRFDQVCSIKCHSINSHNTIFFMINLDKYYFFIWFVFVYIANSFFICIYSI